MNLIRNRDVIEGHAKESWSKNDGEKCMSRSLEVE